MWEVQGRGPANDDYEMLTPSSDTIHARDATDMDSATITSVRYGLHSYQSTSYLIIYSLCLITALLLILTIATIGASIASPNKTIFAITGIMPSVTFASGDCDQLKYANYALHLLINCLGTGIVACSNYLQQSTSSHVSNIVCTSPTFEDIKNEMLHYGDVSFGSNSPRALFRRGHKTMILIWTLLILTSLPIHLFLNGVTGYSIRAYPVTGRVLVANITADPTTFQKESQWKPGRIQRMDCAQYLVNAENWVTAFDNLTIVVDTAADEFPYNLTEKYQGFVENWDKGFIEEDGPPSANEIDRCYINARIPDCTITVRWFPLAATTIALIIKTVTAILAVRKTYHFKHRLYNSLGDIIAVATRHREELGMPGECLANKGEYKKQGLRALYTVGDVRTIPKRAAPIRRRWIRYLGFLDWTVWLFWVGSVVAVWLLMFMSLVPVRRRFLDENGSEYTNIFTLFSIAGFGKVSLAFLLSNNHGGQALDGEQPLGLPLQIAMANAPQLWLSLGYFLWNNQVTRIWGEHEWRSYAGRRKIPRVSYGADSPGVRNTRWLQLPYVLSATLMSISTVMHWVVSQALFVVEVEDLSNARNATAELIFAICYSPTAIFAIGVMAMALIAFITIYYFIPFRSWMPVMAGSARVVFASCTALPKHLPAAGIMWGDVSDEWGRLAGFGESANALQMGEIYPKRYKRTTAAHAPTEPTSESPVTARTSTKSPVIFNPFIDRPSSIASRQSIEPSYRQVNTGTLPPIISETGRTPKYARPVTATTTSSTSRAERPLSLKFPLPRDTRDHFDTNRAGQSPQTRRPRDTLEYGTGYDTEEAQFKRRFNSYINDSSEDEEPPEKQISISRSPFLKDEDSEVKPVWRGWGVNPEDNNVSESESDHAEKMQTERRGWGINSTHDTRLHDNEETSLVNQDWRGWGV
jgi:hypothetical protein